MKYFGTDGFRGKANESLTALQAFKVGAAFGNLLKQTISKPTVLIGKDTRLSSGMFEAAIAAGLSAYGCHVGLLDVCPTPMLAHATKNSSANAGIMITASHNPFYDNGIKLFNEEGEKIAEEIEQQIERHLEGRAELILPDNAEIGLITHEPEALEKYLLHLKESVSTSLKGYKVVLDCANGASVTTAKRAFEMLEADVIVMHDQPDGLNINVECGSTHPHSLIEKVKEEKADMGFAFDGDADRCIAVDHTGELIDGDKTLYICGNFMRDQGELNNDLIVTTVMANLGLFRKWEELKFRTEVTRVGDKYVYEAMLSKDGMLGGEQSGHIIFKKHASTGDGVLTALKLSEVVASTKQSLHDLARDLIIYPQTLKNVRVNDKETALSDVDVRRKMSEIDHRLGKTGRLLVRPSGTEPLVRVMVEAESQEICDLFVKEVVDIIVAKRL